ncbi:MAG: glucosaminidase domain-containing protein [Acidimicrobiales bacterium]
MSHFRANRPPTRTGAAALFAVILLACTLIGAGNAAAQTPPTQPPGGTTGPAPAPATPSVADPSGKVRALLAEVNVMNAQQAIGPAQQHVADMEHVADDAANLLGEARGRKVVADQDVDASRARLGKLAIATYVDPGQTDLESAMNGDPNASQSRRVLLKVAVRREKQTLQAVFDVQTQRKRELDAAEAQKKATDDQVAGAQQALATVQDNIGKAGSELQAATAALNGTGSSTWALTIMGDSAATADEIALWFASRGQPSRAQAPMAQLAGYYISEGKDEGVRGDMAFAQAMLETGSFQNPDTITLNNYAGVGHCDSCPAGFGFASPQLGVRAQIQLLKSYAEKKPKYVHPLVDARLVGPAGCCPTWEQLTRKWATDPNYGPSILEMYRQLLLFVVMHRGLPVPPGAG